MASKLKWRRLAKVFKVIFGYLVITQKVIQSRLSYLQTPAGHAYINSTKMCSKEEGKKYSELKMGLLLNLDGDN